MTACERAMGENIAKKFKIEHPTRIERVIYGKRQIIEIRRLTTWPKVQAVRFRILYGI